MSGPRCFVVLQRRWLAFTVLFWFSALPFPALAHGEMTTDWLNTVVCAETFPLPNILGAKSVANSGSNRWPAERFKEVLAERCSKAAGVPILGAFQLNPFNPRIVRVPADLAPSLADPVLVALDSRCVHDFFLAKTFALTEELTWLDILRGSPGERSPRVSSDLFVVGRDAAGVLSGALFDVRALAGVGRCIRFCSLAPAYKIDPLIAKGDEIAVTAVSGVSAGEMADLGVGLPDSQGRYLMQPKAPEQIYDLARDGRVQAIERVVRPEPRNRATSWIIQSGRRPDKNSQNSCLASDSLPFSRIAFTNGFRGKEQVAGIIDTSLDTNHCFFETNPKAPANAKPKVTAVGSHGADRESDLDFHGTFVAGILAGQDLNDQKDFKNGQAPEANIVFTPLDEVFGLGGIDLYKALSVQYEYPNEARVFNLSFGNDRCPKKAAGGCLFDNLARDVDRFAFEKEDALVVVAVSNGEEVTSPESSFNALAVGASRQSGSCLAEPSYLPGRLENEIGSAGKGPTCDGRRKPEIFAPGCRITSAEARTRCSLANAPGALALPYDKGSTHGSMNAGILDSSSCATSWAAPAVSGAALLVRQYYTDGYYPAGVYNVARKCQPTGALLKAILLNGTVDMQPDGFPSDREGWGRLELDRSLKFNDGDQGYRNTLVVDVRSNEPNCALKTGQEGKLKFEVKDAREPLRVTLVWTNPYSQAPVTGPLGNDLDLVVEYYGASSKTYYGNGVNGDRYNNVEQVVVDAPSVGTYVAKVKAYKVGIIDYQGYSLVVSGGGLIFYPSSACTPIQKPCGEMPSKP